MGGVLVQRLNTSVFADPVALVDNAVRIAEHLESTPAGRPGAPPAPLATTGGGLLWEDANGFPWRALPWIDGAAAPTTVADADEARPCGLAFGAYLAALSDLEPTPTTVLPGFHDTGSRFDALESAAAANAMGRIDQCAADADSCMALRDAALLLDRRAASGEIPCRVVHNDAKPSNVLRDRASGRPQCVIDLDTTQYGLAAHDFGDLVRSATSRSAEDETDISRVTMEGDLLAAVAEGWLEGTGGILTTAEKGSLWDGCVAILAEQAARFLADHLSGDTYYPVDRANQNLDRARVQMALLEDLTRHRDALVRIVE